MKSRNPLKFVRWISELSAGRLAAVVIKEFRLMMRDRVTLALMVGIPLIQTVLFGFAINTDPRHLPTLIRSGDESRFTRAVLATMTNTGYFKMLGRVESDEEADMALRVGDAQFIVTIPPDFSRKIVRGERPSVLIEADATDPVATGNAISALVSVVNGETLKRELRPPATAKTGHGVTLPASASPIDIVVHKRFNPESVTAYNIVPGLLGVVLTMTLVLITALAITREKERGTMENLLATPARPIEIILGKIIPYILVGYTQVCVILLAAKILFNVPIMGNVPLLLVLAIVFISANLGMGLTFSTIGQNQIQSVQLAFFFFLPSLLLSGFMFPFRGMPDWAQSIGSILPLTHFLRIVRGILLKGNGLAESLPEVWPIFLFMLTAVTVAVIRFRNTLD